MSVQDLALQRNKYKHLSDTEWRWFLQQAEGRERTADKLPAFAAIEDWWYPVRLSCEQCSSELTAKYKAEIIHPSLEGRDGVRLLDLTGGYGVDTYFLSEQFEHTDYVEQNAELCRIAEHNKEIKNEKLKIKNISIHNCTAEEFLSNDKRPLIIDQYDLIFLDPARRDSHGGKVFRLGDCTPNVVELMPDLVSHLAPEGRIMLKLSPMLDISQAIKELSAINWDIYVVAIKNEVKEVLLLSGGNGTITAIDLTHPEQAFTFTREEESAAISLPFTGEELCSVERPVDGRRTMSGLGFYLYEPSASILKAGAYKLTGERFGLQKLDVNTHLYVSDQYIAHFPGRVWKIQSTITHPPLPITNANVLVRNYPLTAEQLKKKLRLRDGGTEYIIGCRVAGKPTVFLAERRFAIGD